MKEGNQQTDGRVLVDMTTAVVELLQPVASWLLPTASL